MIMGEPLSKCPTPHPRPPDPSSLTWGEGHGRQAANKQSPYVHPAPLGMLNQARFQKALPCMLQDGCHHRGPPASMPGANGIVVARGDQNGGVAWWGPQHVYLRNNHRVALLILRVRIVGQIFVKNIFFGPLCGPKKFFRRFVKL